MKRRTEADVENWAYNRGEKVNVERQNEVPEQIWVWVRQVIRDMFLDKKRIPTLDSRLNLQKNSTTQEK